MNTISLITETGRELCLTSFPQAGVPVYVWQDTSTGDRDEHCATSPEEAIRYAWAAWPGCTVGEFDGEDIDTESEIIRRAAKGA